jgi:ABC-type antimicrobial peptide transport system permease subunit
MVLTGGIAGVEIPGQEVRNRRSDGGVSLRLVSSQFFATMGVPVVRGRIVEDADDAARPLVAVVSESLGKHFWPDQDPIGRTFRIRGQDRTVVGVVGDIKVRGLERTNEPQVYLPVAQPPEQLGGLYVPKDLVIRTASSIESLLPSIRQVIRRVDQEQPISDVRFLADVVQGETASRRAQLRVLGALALIALLLTGVGIHGLLAFMVAQRSQEIGVRLALGAAPAQLARMIMGEAARLAVLGAVPGILLAYWAARTMRSLLFGIEPADPMTIGVGVVVVMLVTFAGSLVPALRAVRVSPLVAMRAE